MHGRCAKAPPRQPGRRFSFSLDAPMTTLRPDQQKLMDAASAQLRAGNKRGGIQAPTGFGKTALAVHMVGTAKERGFQSLFVVPRRELLSQASRTFSAQGVTHGLIAAGVEPDPKQLVQIATVGALRRRIATIGKPRFVIWDEAHRIAAPGMTDLQAELPDAFHVGLSATWLRLDGRGFGDHFGFIVRGPSVRWLQKRGHLSPCRHYAPNTVDLSGVRTCLGDYHRGDLIAAVRRSGIDEDAVRAWARFARKRTVLFSTSIEQSEHTATSFNAAGIPAKHVDGKTPTAVRDAAIARFERGETLVLCNVNLFTEGFDVPAIEAVLMLRPTKSLGLYLQMAGRALRPAMGKKHAIIIDLVGNYARHGLVEDERRWSLDAPRAEPEDHSRRLTVCAACDLVAEHRGFCTACGAPPKPYRRDELELWQELVANPGLSDRLRSMRRQELLQWADDERKLRIAALVLGFKTGWAWHRQLERERGVA
jgi:DNA repair protein RadD